MNEMIPVSYNLPTLPSPTEFEAYSRSANLMPVLSSEDERHYLELWREVKDPEAAKMLVLSHLRLVIRVVKNHQGYGVSPGDLAQEGTIGLMKAVKGFDPAFGVRFAAYALRWVEAEIREYIFRNWRLVRLSGSSAMKKLFFGYRKTLAELRSVGDNRKIPVEEIAEALGLSEDQVKTVESYFRGGDYSLSAPSDDDSEELENNNLIFNSLPSLPVTQETPETGLILHSQKNQIQLEVSKALTHLSEREQDIVKSRMLVEPSVGLVELGKKWGISAERVRQVEVQAIKKLKNELKDFHEQTKVY